MSVLSSSNYELVPCSVAVPIVDALPIDGHAPYAQPAPQEWTHAHVAVATIQPTHVSSLPHVRPGRQSAATSYSPLDLAQSSGEVVDAAAAGEFDAAAHEPQSGVSELSSWIVSALDSVGTNRSRWCAACVCLYCSVYSQRKRLLLFTNEPYNCFQVLTAPGSGNSHLRYTPKRTPPAPRQWPPSGSTFMPESSSRYDDCAWNLCLEVAVCPCAALLANRRVMKHRFKLRATDECDDNICANTAQAYDQISIYCRCVLPLLPCSWILACLHTQQAAQLEYEEKRFMERRVDAVARVGHVRGAQLVWESPRQQDMQ